MTASADALTQQLQLATRLAGLLAQSSQALLTARSEEAQLKSLAAAAGAADAVHAYEARLAELIGSAEPGIGESGTKEVKPEAAQTQGGPPPPALPQANLKEAQEQVAGLYAEVTRADAAPTMAQLAATDTVQGEVTGLLDSWQKLQADLPELNKRLRDAKLAPVRTDLAPPRDVNLADEE